MLLYYILVVGQIFKNVIEDNMHVRTDIQITDQKKKKINDQHEETIFVSDSETVGKGKILFYLNSSKAILDS